MNSKINQIFISYAWDTETMNDVWQFCEFLLASDSFDETGIMRRNADEVPNILWLDRREMRGNIDETMERSIKNSKLAIVFLTEKYQQSRNCQFEFIHIHQQSLAGKLQSIIVNMGKPESLVRWTAEANELQLREALNAAKQWLDSGDRVQIVEQPFYSLKNIAERFHLLENEMRNKCPELLNFGPVSYSSIDETNNLIHLKVFFTEHIPCLARNLCHCKVFVDHQCYSQNNVQRLKKLRFFLRKYLYDKGDVIFEIDRNRNEELRMNFERFREITVFVALVTAGYDVNLIRQANEHWQRIILVRFGDYDLSAVDDTINGWDESRRHAPAVGYKSMHINLRSERLAADSLESGYWIRLKQMIITLMNLGKREPVAARIYADHTSAIDEAYDYDELRNGESHFLKEKLKLILSGPDKPYLIVYGERGVGKTSLIGMLLRSASNFNDILRSFEFVLWLSYDEHHFVRTDGTKIVLSRNNFINEWLIVEFHKHVEHLKKDFADGKSLTQLISHRALLILDNVPQHRLIEFPKLLEAVFGDKVAFAIVCDGLVTVEHPFAHRIEPRTDHEIRKIRRMRKPTVELTELEDSFAKLSESCVGLPLAADVMLSDLQNSGSSEARRSLAESYIRQMSEMQSSLSEEISRSKVQEIMDERLLGMFERLEQQHFVLMPRFRELFIFNHNRSFSLHDVQLVWDTPDIAVARKWADTLQQRSLIRSHARSNEIEIHWYLSRAFLLFEEKRNKKRLRSNNGGISKMHLRLEILSSITQRRPNFLFESREREKLVDAVFDADKPMSTFDNIKEEDVVKMLVPENLELVDAKFLQDQLAEDINCLSAYFPQRSTMLKFLVHLLDNRPRQLRKIFWQLFHCHGAKITMEYLFSLSDSFDSLKNIKKILECCIQSLMPNAEEGGTRTELQKIGKLLVEFGGLAAQNELQARERLQSNVNYRRLFQSVPPQTSSFIHTSEDIQQLAESGCYTTLSSHKKVIQEQMTASSADEERFLKTIVSTNQLNIYEMFQDPSAPKNTFAHAVLCVENGLLQMLHLIRKKYDPEILIKKDNIGRTLAFDAALKGHTHIMEYILRYYKEHLDLDATLSQRDVNGRTILFEAAVGNHWNVIEYLIEANYINKNRPSSSDNDGRNLTFEAASFGSFDFVDQVKETGLDRCTDLKKLFDSNGQTPAFVAVKLGNAATLKELDKRGVDLTKPDSRGWNLAFQLSLAKTGISTIASILQSKKINFNSYSKDGFTPIMEACKQKNVEAFRALKAAGATIQSLLNPRNSQANERRTILSFAVAGHDKGLFDFILNNCLAEIEALIELDEDILVRAIKTGDDHFVVEVLKKGADRPSIFSRIAPAVCEALTELCTENNVTGCFNFPERIIDAFQQFASHSLTEYFVEAENMLNDAIIKYDSAKLSKLLFLGARPVKQNILELTMRSLYPITALKHCLCWPNGILLSEGSTENMRSEGPNDVPENMFDNLADPTTKILFMRYVLTRNVTEKVTNQELTRSNALPIKFTVKYRKETCVVLISPTDTGPEVQVRIFRKFHIAENDFWRYDITLGEIHSIIEENNVYQLLEPLIDMSEKLHVEERKAIGISCYERHTGRLCKYEIILKDLIEAENIEAGTINQIAACRQLPPQNLALFPRPFNRSHPVSSAFLTEILRPRSHFFMEIMVPLKMYRKTRNGGQYIGLRLLNLDDPISLYHDNFELTGYLKVTFLESYWLSSTSFNAKDKCIFRLDFQDGNYPLKQQLKRLQLFSRENLEMAFKGLHALSVVKLEVIRKWRSDYFEALDTETVGQALDDNTMKKRIFVLDEKGVIKTKCELNDPLWQWIECENQNKIRLLKK